MRADGSDSQRVTYFLPFCSFPQPLRTARLSRFGVENSVARKGCNVTASFGGQLRWLSQVILQHVGFFTSLLHWELVSLEGVCPLGLGVRRFEVWHGKSRSLVTVIWSRDEDSGEKRVRAGQTPGTGNLSAGRREISPHPSQQEMGTSLLHRQEEEQKGGWKLIWSYRVCEGHSAVVQGISCLLRPLDPWSTIL